ncbi:MAG: NAD(P)/FAD-dependent oxidoreductase [Beutenbergiaceae bacterium]
MSRTVVVGGGYAGVMAANRLAGSGQVTLVTKQPTFIERIRLHRAIIGREVGVGFGELLHPGVNLVIDAVSRIDSAAGTVTLTSAGELTFDHLVYAVGSGVARPGSGMLDVNSYAAAMATRAELDQRPEADVLVIGSGLTGVELAATLAVAGRRVSMVTSAAVNTRSAAAHLTRLGQLGVTIHRDTRFDPAMDTGQIIIDATGFAVPPLAEHSGLPVAPDGRLLVDATLRVPGASHIVGAGDAVLIDDPSAAHLRPACATALPMGAHAADVVAALQAGRRPELFSLGYTVLNVDVGGGRGHIQLLRPDDGEHRLALTGRPGGAFKEFICRMTLTWLKQERKRPGRYSWRRGPAPQPASVEADSLLERDRT